MVFILALFAPRDRYLLAEIKPQARRVVRGSGRRTAARVRLNWRTFISHLPPRRMTLGGRRRERELKGPLAACIHTIHRRTTYMMLRGRRIERGADCVLLENIITQSRICQGCRFVRSFVRAHFPTISTGSKGNGFSVLAAGFEFGLNKVCRTI